MLCLFHAVISCLKTSRGAPPSTLPSLPLLSALSWKPAPADSQPGGPAPRGRGRCHPGEATPAFGPRGDRWDAVSPESNSTGWWVDEAGVRKGGVKFGPDGRARVTLAGRLSSPLEGEACGLSSVLALRPSVRLTLPGRESECEAAALFTSYLVTLLAERRGSQTAAVLLGRTHPPASPGLDEAH